MNWFAFISYVFVTSFTPGPNNIMSMTNASRHGLRKSFRFNLGVGAGFFVLMLLCNYLSLALATMLPRFRLVMSIVGAAYMVYLAVKVVWSKESAAEGPLDPPQSFWAGLGLQFVNPKAIMYGLTVAASFVLPYTHSQPLLVVIALVLAFVGLASTTSWSLFGSLFQRLLVSYRRPFNVAMGLLLLYSAVSVLH